MASAVRVRVLCLLLVMCVNSLAALTTFGKAPPTPPPPRRQIPQVTIPHENLLATILRNSSYDKNVRPPTSDGPVNVIVNMFLRPDTTINHERDEFNIQVTFRQEWVDQRLSYNEDDRQPYVILNDLSLIWIPDTFFANERQGRRHDLNTPNEFVRIHPDGKVMYSSRISLNLYCDLSSKILKSYPFDSPRCELRAASYGYTTDDVELVWKEDTPVQIPTDVVVPGYTFVDIIEDTCLSLTSTGGYSCLKAVVRFTRQSFPHLLNLFFPLLLFVVTSWFSFWLPHDSVPRLAVVLTMQLAVAFQLQINKELFLHLSYATALDVWAGTCSFLVFSVFLEYLYVSYLNRHDHQKLPSRPVLLENPEEHKTGDDEETVVATYKFLWGRTSGRTSRPDVISRVVYPAVFLVFNIVYWPSIKYL